jgi:Ca2+/Na+ antiporter
MEPYLPYIGGVAGSLIGILGGAYGTWCALQATQGPRERGFMVRAAIGTWILVLAFAAGLFLLPTPYNYLLWLLYVPGLVLGVMWLNKQQASIRQQEAAGK